MNEVRLGVLGSQPFAISESVRFLVESHVHERIGMINAIVVLREALNFVPVLGIEAFVLYEVDFEPLADVTHDDLLRQLWANSHSGLVEQIIKLCRFSQGRPKEATFTLDGVGAA